MKIYLRKRIRAGLKLLSLLLLSLMLTACLGSSDSGSTDNVSQQNPPAGETGDNTQDTGDGDQSAGDGDQSTGDNDDQGSGDGDQGSGDGDQGSGDNDQSSGDGDQSTDDNDQGSGDQGTSPPYNENLASPTFDDVELGYQVVKASWYMTTLGKDLVFFEERVNESGELEWAQLQVLADQRTSAPIGMQPISASAHLQQLGEGTGRYKAYACDPGATPDNNPASCSAPSAIVDLHTELADWAGTIALVKGFTGNDPQATADAKYGYSIAIAPQKNWLAVGAPGENNGKGAVYIYTRETLGPDPRSPIEWERNRPPVNSWVPRKRITPPGGAQGTGTEFGYSLAIVNNQANAGGDILAVGMPGNSWAAYGSHRFSQLEDPSYAADLEYRVGLPEPFVANSGAVFTYRLRGNTQAITDAESIVKPFNTHEGQRFGESIAMAERAFISSGNFSCEIGRLVVGAPGDRGTWKGKINFTQFETNRTLQTNTSLQKSGAVFLLVQRPEILGCLEPGVEPLGWSETFAIKSSQANEADDTRAIDGNSFTYIMPQQSRLGASVAITADGDYLLAGAPGERGTVSFLLDGDAAPESNNTSNILSGYPAGGVQSFSFTGDTPRGAAYLFNVYGEEKAYLRRGSGDTNAEEFGQAVAIQRTDDGHLRLLISDQKTEVAAFESLEPVSVNNSSGELSGQALFGVTNRTLQLDTAFTGSVNMAMSHDGKFAVLGTASADDTTDAREGFVMLDFDTSGHPRVLENTPAVVSKPNNRTYQAFGQAVSLSADGQRLVIGAPLDSCSAPVVTASAEDAFCVDTVNDSGAVYVY
ncbi:hypothetical protein SAMN05660443_1768 [Marinospirillum celere]|uniref:Uncharacterized protein n=1 Tax=Marinospirillum celere TaxID=1122252 RepID=A0A1I1HAR7_9GAMM|nr:hypothetical protein [Marinospirillum celere]SFC18200.1 hypothetical protein SAMN05660443_1768 [Marinospirillum celere]